MAQLRSIVVKVGSAVIAPTGAPENGILRDLAHQVGLAHRAGMRITLVSSGAIASGFASLGLGRPPKRIAQKQAAAAVGQPRLMAAWANAFAAEGLTTAQALYTAEDLRKRERYLNTRRTLAELLSRGIVPIVNENDTTSFAEIKLGDNDRLSALTADLVDADLLIILSTAKGLYRGGRAGQVISVVAYGQDASEHITTGKSAVGTGGFATKLDAAKLAAAWGIPTVVAGGTEPDVITRILRGEPLGTRFLGRATRTSAKKRWLAGRATDRTDASGGLLTVDAGAARAIAARGASLLPGGITGVYGEFARDAVVGISADGEVFARGIAAYSSEEIRKIAGKPASQIERALGYCFSDEVVHRDDMVILTKQPEAKS